MADCINCKCTPTTDCAELQQQNEEKLREFATHYKYLQTCQLAEEGSKGFYNVWCMLKSVIGMVCQLKGSINSIKAGNNITLDDDGTSITIHAKDTTYKAGSGLRLSGDNTFSVTGFVSEGEYNKTKGAFEALLRNLKGSGAWIQTGDTIFDGYLAPNRNIATGNINLFGGTPDGSSFIRTNNGQTENDLAGGI